MYSGSWDIKRQMAILPDGFRTNLVWNDSGVKRPVLFAMPLPLW